MPVAPRQIVPKILVPAKIDRHSEVAFYHALAATVKRRARLTLLHAGPGGQDPSLWDEFPGVRETLAKWKLLPEDAPRTAVAQKLNVGVSKMAVRDTSPRQGIAEYVRKHPTDLLVMTTEGRTGLGRLFKPSIAESVSYRTKSHALLLPKSGQGFVDPDSGKSSLRRVLCALDPDKDPRSTLAYLVQWLPALADGEIDVTFVDTREEDDYPLELPNADGQHWRNEKRTGDIVDALISLAGEAQYDVVVMHASRPLRPLKRVQGSRIDRVLQSLKLPVLSVPKTPDDTVRT